MTTAPRKLPAGKQAERPIIFSGPMVRAILDGTKTMTRREVKPQPTVGTDGTVKFPWATFFANGHIHTWDNDGVGGQNWQANDHPDENPYEQALKRTPYVGAFPFGAPGDRLWVREVISKPLAMDVEARNFTGFYRVGNEERWERRKEQKTLWISPIYMPRWASRLTLEITAVKVERLGSISPQDVIAEGVECLPEEGTLSWALNCRSRFFDLWDSIHGMGAQDKNPWLWCVSFKRIDREGT